jgi:hypothetical protein
MLDGPLGKGERGSAQQQFHRGRGWFRVFADGRPVAGAVLAASLCLAASAPALADALPWGSSIWPSLGCTSGICTIGDGNSSIAFTAPVTAQDGSLPPGLDLEQATLTEDGVLATSTAANTRNQWTIGSRAEG